MTVATLERPMTQMQMLASTPSDMRVRVKSRPVINIDVDGVLYDYVGSFTDFARAHTGEDLPRPLTWNFWDEWDMTHAEWLRLFELGVERNWIWGPGYMIPGADAGMQALSDMDFHIRIVTSKMGFKGMNAQIGTNTMRWLDANKIPYRSIAFLTHGESKASYKASLLLDDNEDNLREFAQAGGKSVVFDQPYNRTLSKFFYPRAMNWSEAVRVIELELP